MLILSCRTSLRNQKALGYPDGPGKWLAKLFDYLISYSGDDLTQEFDATHTTLQRLLSDSGVSFRLQSTMGWHCDEAIDVYEKGVKVAL